MCCVLDGFSTATIPTCQEDLQKQKTILEDQGES